MSQKPTEDKTDKTCVWNREFLDNYPFDFLFTTELPVAKVENGKVTFEDVELESEDFQPVSAGKPLAEYIAMIRIARNGAGVFTWEGTPGKQETTIKIDGTSVVSKALFEGPVPLSLYVLPTGADQAEKAKLAAEKKIGADWRTNLTAGLSAVIAANAPPELEEAYQCFRSQIEYLSQFGNKEAQDRIATRIKQLDTRVKAHKVQSETPWRVQGRISSGAARPKTRSNGSVLENDDVLLIEHPDGRFSFERYSAASRSWTKDARPTNRGGPVVVEESGKRLYFARLDGKGPFTGVPEYGSLEACEVPSGSSEALRTAIVDTEEAAKLDAIASQVQQYRGPLEAALAAMPPEQAKRVRESLFWVQNVERLTLATMDAVERARKALPTIAAAARNATKDPDTFKRSYLAFARSLPQFDDAVVKPTSNPAPGPDERALDMRFRNPATHYWGLVWNGLPVSIVGAAGVKTELQLENAIPFIDIFGAFFQRSSKFTYWSFGGGLFGASEMIQRPSNDETYKTSFNVGFQVNGSLAGVHLGIGHIFREPDRDNAALKFLSKDNLRILVGADLISFFTGTQTAVYKPLNSRSDAADPTE